jgi:transposase
MTATSDLVAALRRAAEAEKRAQVAETKLAQITELVHIAATQFATNVDWRELREILEEK